jgi:hypothetical protein
MWFDVVGCKTFVGLHRLDDYSEGDRDSSDPIALCSLSYVFECDVKDALVVVMQCFRYQPRRSCGCIGRVSGVFF